MHRQTFIQSTFDAVRQNPLGRPYAQPDYIPTQPDTFIPLQPDFIHFNPLQVSAARVYACVCLFNECKPTLSLSPHTLPQDTGNFSSSDDDVSVAPPSCLCLPTAVHAQRNERTEQSKLCACIAGLRSFAIALTPCV